MSASRRVLVFGTPEDLAQPEARDLAQIADVEWVLRDKVPPPTKGKIEFEIAVFVWSRAEARDLSGWQAWFAALKTPLSVVVYARGEFPVALRAAFAPAAVVAQAQGSSALFAALSKATASGHTGTSVEPLPVTPPSPVDDLAESMSNVSKISELSLSVPDISQRELPSASDDPFADLLGPSDAVKPVAASLEEDFEKASESSAVRAPAHSEEEVLALDDVGLPVTEQPAASEEAPSAWLVPPESSQVASDPETLSPEAGEAMEPGALWGAAADEVPAPVEAPAAPVVADGTGWAAAAVTDDDDSVVEMAQEPVGAPVRGKSKAAAAAQPEYSEPVVDDVPLVLGKGLPEDIATLRRYAALKERDAREKDSALQALNRQIEQIRERLAKSEAERRRLTMSLGDAEVLRKSLEDERDQHKHHVEKAEAAHQEEMRSFQLRLDNAQFQATRAERKLEDFRERVKIDIQKIRVRERELTNRLELQKRDAEALLIAKDERLLQQKREIDRLEFELESLRERLVEQTQKAEERVGRLSRALKALKMAQGMLSGIEDEVLPNAAEKMNDGDEEAA